MESTMKIKLPHILEDKDRHGNPRVYYRRAGRPMVRLHAPPSTDAFLDEYRRARDSIATPPAPATIRAVAGSLRTLIEGYYASSSFTLLGPSTQRARRGILEGICLSKTKTGALRADLPFSRLEMRHVREMRDEKAELPEAANGRIKAIRHVFTWAIDNDLTKFNPADGIGYRASNSDGHHTWTVDEVRVYEDRHPVGTKARLALGLLLFTGVRRSDVVKLGRQYERDGVLRFTETKGSTSRALNRKGPSSIKKRILPILPILRGLIDATPSRNLTYLTTAYDKPFTSNGFGNRFRKWCDAAGLGHCSAHGLRKAGATIAAENGATGHQLMAIFGWTTLRQADHYTKDVNRERLAREGMHLLEPRRGEQNGR